MTESLTAEKQTVLKQVSLLQKELQDKFEENEHLQEELQFADQRREEVVSEIEYLKKEFFCKEQEYKNIIDQTETDKVGYNNNMSNLKEDFFAKEQDYERIIMEMEGNLKEKMVEILQLQQVVSNLNAKLEVISF